MALDSHVKRLLEEMAALKQQPMWEIGPRAARAAMRSSIFRTSNDPDCAVEDRSVPGPAGSIPVRLYAPRDAAPGLLPGMMFFHGGGFVIGDLETHDGLCRWLAVGGNSAGGALAAVVAQLARAAGSPRLAFQLLIYPIAQMGADTETASMRDNAKGYFLERASMDWFTRCYAPDPKHRGDPRLSPILCKDLAGLPPAYVITAGFDPLHDEGRDYADALARAGVPMTYVNYPGMIHGFLSFRGRVGKAREAVAAAAGALRAALAD